MIEELIEQIRDAASNCDDPVDIALAARAEWAYTHVDADRDPGVPEAALAQVAAIACVLLGGWREAPQAIRDLAAAEIEFE